MNIKDPVLVYKFIKEIYEVDVNGTKVIAKYSYDLENEQGGGWDYDLTPCYEGLDEDEISDLEDDFYQVLCEYI
jgi:hypothetical protein